MNDAQDDNIVVANLVGDHVFPDDNLSCVWCLAAAASVGELVQAINGVPKSPTKALRGKRIALCNPSHLLIETGDRG